MQPRDVEAIVRAEFRRLPPLQAPDTLLPRVMAAVQAWARRPWYARAWFTWPLSLQAAFVAALMLLVAGGAAIWPQVQGAVIEIVSGPVADILDLLAPPVRSAETAAQTARVLWRAVLEPLVTYVSLVVGLMCVTCAALGMAIGRLTSATQVERP